MSQQVMLTNNLNQVIQLGIEVQGKSESRRVEPRETFGPVDKASVTSYTKNLIDRGYLSLRKA